MKVLIVSDTHRNEDNLEAVLEIEKPIDMLIHLGDIGESEDYIEAIAECNCEMVAGNNDFFSELPMEKELYLGNYKILITHGHLFYVSSGNERILNEGNLRGCNMIMFGHTHVPFIEEVDGITLINPGSLTYPRQPGRQPSYIIMDIDDYGQAQYGIKYLED